jgi:hypothetical protein
MTSSRISFDALVWEHDGSAGWHFLSVPEAVADDLEMRFGHRAAGFGSLRVEVTIGSTCWQTSLFPDRKQSTYVLPLKKAVRAAEGLVAGSTATVELVVLA